MLMKRMLASFVALAALLAAVPSFAQTATWNIDPAHSASQFAVRHLVISTVRGQFGKTAGTVQFDGSDYATIVAEATIDVASVDTREAGRDKHLRSADFFDAEKFPTITFKSKRAEGISGNTFLLVGDLTIRGVTKEVVLRVEATPIVKGMRGESRVGAHATGKINRHDFGVNWNRAVEAGGLVVGNDVEIVIDLELIKQ
jgi:polyisoprenoid-binding protein YceI